MPNSNWTETGTAISLAPSTSPITAAEDVNHLTNGDKIALMSQYAAELATKTLLDTTASGLSVSSAAYDTSVANISVGLIAAGAPSNWATTWPDGTTSGPWPNIQTDLGNLWGAVAVQRTSLQTAISYAQAAAAQAAAFAAIVGIPTTVTTLPTLPSTSYPAGSFVFNSTTGIMYGTDGTTWAAQTVAGSQLIANSVTAAKIAAGTITATEIAAGAITSAKIAAGAVTADMITTGTLDASVVTVTNLNASNISTGTLSASKVLFSDGSALTTASRVLTSSGSLATDIHWTAPPSSPSAITGLGWTVTAESTSDTFNISAILFETIGWGTETPGPFAGINVYTLVDGTVQAGCTLSFDVVAGGPLTYITSLTGLSAGSHTIQIAVDYSLCTDLFILGGSYALMQRIY